MALSHIAGIAREKSVPETEPGTVVCVILLIIGFAFWLALTVVFYWLILWSAGWLVDAGFVHPAFPAFVFVCAFVAFLFGFPWAVFFFVALMVPFGVHEFAILAFRSLKRRLIHETPTESS